MPTHAEAPSAESVEAWIAYEEAALDGLRAKLHPLLEEERRATDRLARLKDLLSAYTAPEQGELHTATTTTRMQSVAERVRGQVREILASTPTPLHIHEVHAAFLQRGWTVPGAGTPANITAHLSGAADIVSPTRGYYRLLGEGEQPPERKAATRKARTRRSAKRRRSTTRKSER